MYVHVSVVGRVLWGECYGEQWDHRVKVLWGTVGP